MYKTVFDLFDICVDVRHGNFLHLPAGENALDQPAKTMDSLKYLQSLLRQKMIDEEKRRIAFRKR
jgi:hypothetical protein